ncbi:MAG: glutamate-5-semialdehyde dehydrogenase [Alphaproteobacteria bacterium]|nr:glutamate-5-semialdehyde dehydrogenase [Alphaproteobacteria bacterium]
MTMVQPTHISLEQIGYQARLATGVLMATPVGVIDQALNDLADTLMAEAQVCLDENKKDVLSAQNKKLSPALIDRLTLNLDRISAMAGAMREVATLADPCGLILDEWQRPNGLFFQKISVPIGVLGMIYESRPNVTLDSASLCLKSRNAIILRGGSDSLHSSGYLVGLIRGVLKKHGLPEDAVQMAPTQDRDFVGEMLKANGVIDVMIPRGGKELTARVLREATMPVFAHLDGNCHIYVHASAKPDMAVQVILNAKLRRTGICGAAESLLFDQNLPQATAQRIISALLDRGCDVAGDTPTQFLDLRVTPATDDDWGSEYLSAKISCKYVADVHEAIHHINRYGSHHTDSILAEDPEAVALFLMHVDSAIVMHNTSTQFADGGEFGMGAEIGIGTGKLHARGPVGLYQLTTFKYVVRGQGQVRA